VVTKPLSLPGRTEVDISSVDEALALVRASGGRATPSKRILLEILFATDAHLSAEDLAAAVQERAPDVHLSTVYRNLEDLQRIGVIAHTHLGHGPSTYQLASHTHAHFICGECGTRVEAPDELFAGLALQAKSSLGFTIDPHHFAILGRCAACAGRT
jgi:Fe2+ or Zn2+ uptake regulation protein